MPLPHKSGLVENGTFVNFTRIRVDENKLFQWADLLVSCGQKAVKWIIQWKLDMGLTKGQYTDKICALHRALLHIFYYYWGKENRLLCSGLRYIEVPMYAVLKISEFVCTRPIILALNRFLRHFERVVVLKSKEAGSFSVHCMELRASVKWSAMSLSYISVTPKITFIHIFVSPKIFIAPPSGRATVLTLNCAFLKWISCTVNEDVALHSKG